MKLTDVDETYLDSLVVAPEDQELLDKIRLYYRDTYLIYESDPSIDCDRNFIIFCYNLAAMGFRKEAEVMLTFVNPEYYLNHFLNDIKEAGKHLQAAEDLKNRIDFKSKEIIEHHKEMAEYIEVATGVIEFAMVQLLFFPGKAEFMTFLKQLQADPIKLIKRPVISLVK